MLLIPLEMPRVFAFQQELTLVAEAVPLDLLLFGVSGGIGRKCPLTTIGHDLPDASVEVFLQPKNGRSRFCSTHRR